MREREFKYWPRIPENVVSTQKKVITFEKVIVWQFDRFCILGLLSGSLLTSIATMPIPPQAPQWRASLVQWRSSLICSSLICNWDSCDPNISGILWKSWGLFTPYYEAVARHIQYPEYAFCSPPSLSLPWTHQRTLSSPPSRVVLILTPSSPSSHCFRGARGFVSPYKCYKYVCTRAALHRVEDYAGTKKYYFVIVTFSLIFPPLPPL